MGHPVATYWVTAQEAWQNISNLIQWEMCHPVELLVTTIFLSFWIPSQDDLGRVDVALGVVAAAAAGSVLALRGEGDLLEELPVQEPLDCQEALLDILTSGARVADLVYNRLIQSFCGDK